MAISDALGRWGTWVGHAVAVEVYSAVPYIGDTVTVAYEFDELVELVVHQVAVVGGCLFRAGMLYARARPAVAESPSPD